MHKLEVKNLKKTIKKTEIIKGISLFVKNGEIVGLLGPNGAGKTTTFYMICGLIPASDGEIFLGVGAKRVRELFAKAKAVAPSIIFLDNNEISKISLNKRARLGIGYLPQESSIFKDLSVEENLMLAAEITYKDENEANKKVNEMLFAHLKIS